MSPAENFNQNNWFLDVSSNMSYYLIQLVTFPCRQRFPFILGSLSCGNPCPYLGAAWQPQRNLILRRGHHRNFGDASISLRVDRSTKLFQLIYRCSATETNYVSKFNRQCLLNIISFLLTFRADFLKKTNFFAKMPLKRI